MSQATAFPVLNASHDALRTVAARLTAADWDSPTPCADWTVLQVLRHAAGDQLGFAAALTGENGPDFNPFEPSGKPEDGEDPHALLERAVAASAAAWATVAPDAEQVAVPVPPNQMTAQIGAAACALDAAVHAWDLAVATGQPSPLTPELARPLLAAARTFVEPLRQWGAYAAALETGGDDVAALLGYLGRRPA
ncbi:TIGR03086 family metal-binding protein [Actinomadura hibisca]|uniref:TIGR03086 family metal-binding protein n=1 Tax=Actinomadura hibisca TaxID=68565 RepID=UPI00082B900E|nr:TIGR03086 family metal-binding protein [Actinomadura hibisca]